MPRPALPTRALDVLRAVAVLSVLVDHTIVAQTGETRTLWVLGRLGVLLFFVHTALVLMASLERHRESAGAFYLRRAFRIYPLAIVTILAVVALELPPHAVPGDSAYHAVTGWQLVANLTLTQNVVGAVDVLGPLWSLPLEVQMYVLLPVCFAVTRRGVRATLALFGVAVLLWGARETVPHLWRFSVVQFAPVFMLGVVAYAWLRTHAVRDLRPSWLTARAHTVATYSYGVYLLHVPALGLAFVWGAAWPASVQWAMYALLLVALPAVAYHAIERPGIALGHWLLRPHGTVTEKLSNVTVIVPLENRP